MCAAGRGDRDGDARNGCEADILTDRAHCGRCARACSAGSACAAGACAGDDWVRLAGEVTRVLDIAVAPGGDVLVVGTFTCICMIIACRIKSCRYMTFEFFERLLDFIIKSIIVSFKKYLQRPVI